MKERKRGKEGGERKRERERERESEGKNDDKVKLIIEQHSRN